MKSVFVNASTRSKLIFVLLVLSSSCTEQDSPGKIPSADVPLTEGTPLRVADNGDGTYTNPPIDADYPDPSIIRVGDIFYFATTTFVNVPGLTILESRDLVNWALASHVVPRLDGRPQYDMQDGTLYRRGIYAPSLRHHGGTFWLAVTPVGQKTRIYYTDDVRKPWQFHELDREAFDPALYFDEDGTPYLATSEGRDGTVTLLTLNEHLSEVIAAQAIFYNEGAEGSKIVRRGEYVYMFHSIPRRLGMTVSRAASLFGPWETKNQIDDTTGGHQGAIVDLPDGTDYGFVMLDAGAIGRVTNLSPIHWVDDWPVWGMPDAPGQVPHRAEKPIKVGMPMQPATSDDFSGVALGLQWQWNHNPVDDRWSQAERPGYLRLRPTQAEGFWTARNTLVQKAMGPFSRGEVKMDIGNLRHGDQCGFGTLGKFSAYVAIHGGANGQYTLTMQVLEDTKEGQQKDLQASGLPANADHLYLRTDLDFESDTGRVAYSFDGETWTGVRDEFPLAFDWQTGTFQGQQFAIFCFNPQPGAGYLDIDDFRLAGRPRQ